MMDPASMQVKEGVIAFTGPLSAQGLGPVWQKAMQAAQQAKPLPLAIDISGVSVLDTAGASFLLALEHSHGAAVNITGGDDRATALIAQLRGILPPPLDAEATAAALQQAADAARGRSLLEDVKIRVGFFGETVIALGSLPLKLRFLRGADFAHIADNAGLKAVPLVIMLGFLIGMILAFQSAIPMRQYGADLYVAKLVAISLFRELGPLLVAVILAGRTGSAFAAELGTMQVNEEIAALTTMGIDPETMLVIPRMVAAMLVMPGLVVVMDVAGLLGMGVVLMILGFPPSAILGQISAGSEAADFLLGLGKGLIFAAAIALIGCRAGLTAGNGPQAVGEAATSAVVGGIVSTVLLDGLFAVLFYRLGL